jgi:hypothetical protein
MPEDEELETDVGAGPIELVCQLCGVALTPATAHSVSGHAACERCLDQIQAEIAEKEAGSSSVPVAAVGTLVGALAGAAVWAGVSISTGYAIGYIAVLVGFLAGKGATHATGGRHGRPLQIVAVAGALIGLLAANYAIFAHGMHTMVLEEDGTVLSYLDPFITSNFMPYMQSKTGLFDLLWVFLAVSTAWRVPAGPQLTVDRS